MIIRKLNLNSSDLAKINDCSRKMTEAGSSRCYLAQFNVRISQKEK